MIDGCKTSVCVFMFVGLSFSTGVLLRPEMKFKGLDALVTRIRTDISIANTQLEMPDLHAYRRAAGFFHH